MKEILFICVNFNNASDSRRLLASLERQRKSSVEFSIRCLIVDNSTDEEEAAACQQLSRLRPWATYLRTPANLGYFGALNYGMSMESSRGPAFLVIGNNDLEFDEHFCENLLHATYCEKTLAVCPDIVTHDGVHQNPHIRTRINWLRRLQFDFYFAHFYVSRLLLLILKLIRPAEKPSPAVLEACEVHMGVGACYVLTPAFFKRFSKLNYPFFLYGEEAYISDQIHSAGGILWFDPDLEVRHAESATLSRVPSRTSYEYARTGYPDYRRLL